MEQEEQARQKRIAEKKKAKLVAKNGGKDPEIDRMMNKKLKSNLGNIVVDEAISFTAVPPPTRQPAAKATKEGQQQ